MVFRHLKVEANDSVPANPVGTAKGIKNRMTLPDGIIISISEPDMASIKRNNEP